MAELRIEVDDPRRDEIRAVLERHLTFTRQTTPAEYVHALDIEGLLDPAITFFSVRLEGKVVGVGAIKQLDTSHIELKSMHTIVEARRRGIGRALVDHLLAVAAERGGGRISLRRGPPMSSSRHGAFTQVRGLSHADRSAPMSRAPGTTS
jgi:putative acetyltransferase